jgi:hypothetical protein
MHPDDLTNDQGYCSIENANIQPGRYTTGHLVKGSLYKSLTLRKDMTFFYRFYIIVWILAQRALNVSSVWKLTIGYIDRILQNITWHQ